MTTEFKPLNIAILTISDSRTDAEDISGYLLKDLAEASGHHVIDKALVKDDLYQIRREVSRWIAEPEIDVVLTTGGTGITGRDGTPEAVSVLLDKTIEGFGEMFRVLSYEDIKTSTLQSRCLAGVANRTFIFVLPGSKNACKTAWEKIIVHQLDARTKPCNLVMLIPRLIE
ncbi:MAG: molybdenum cofactor biosynthesis protein B [Gammaproteobacteria bacterium]|nr:molybdenum cofactor biosynthesis protein B [Gammaproteobacteria bacterium]